MVSFTVLKGVGVFLFFTGGPGQWKRRQGLALNKSGAFPSKI